MNILAAIAVVFVFLVLYVNIKVSQDIARSKVSTKNERTLSYLLVWLIPLLGYSLFPKRFCQTYIPNLMAPASLVVAVVQMVGAPEATVVKHITSAGNNAPAGLDLHSAASLLQYGRCCRR
ncbi:hypothetical protein FKG94_22665 [Exilibacterium tricleocarpae]|uniref:Uncharacterized protein n=1 Tax=Exilibacterium tricleocarpae TaxID=2591008 RepID=A0A545SXB0_9GAMM|nr:hypothetical protein [Exilibacterium tricleocarpae]TQV69601.1 hypothetical protein FKG94_22665 [Exilibacterium tricleocarpae]